MVFDVLFVAHDAHFEHGDWSVVLGFDFVEDFSDCIIPAGVVWVFHFAVIQVVFQCFDDCLVRANGFHVYPWSVRWMEFMPS